jgi:hypothetical protein
MSHACQDCSWCHDFGNFGFCIHPEGKKLKPESKLSYDDLVTNNDCPHWDDDTWLGG